MNSLNSVSKQEQRAGFTLTDLLVVVGLVTLLAVLVLPALAAGRTNSRDAGCVDNQRRLAAGWLMYASENDDAIMNNGGGGTPTWATGLMQWSSSGNFRESTNRAILNDPSLSAMAKYIRQPEVFKCPADTYQKAGIRFVRSVSLNGALTGNGGSGPLVKGHNPGSNRSYYGAGGPQPTIGSGVKKLSQLNTPGPARTFMVIDEHPDSITDATFLLDPGPAVNAEVWRDLPASYHEGGVGISYADGHAEIHAWQEKRIANPGAPLNGPGLRATIYPVRLSTYVSAEPPVGPCPWNSGGGIMNHSLDFEWLQDGMPYRLF